jgi:adenine-specific DNA methylase
VERWALADDVFVRPLRVSRATSAYAVHAYHTKVPPEAIRPYIEHYTKSGGLVLDPFAGSGMTGLAAGLAGRQAILSDLSPAAVHIARNYTAPCDPEAYRRGVDRLLSWAEPQIEPLYRVDCPTCRGQARTEYLVWSDVRRCPHCTADVCVWDARGETGVRNLTCPSCRAAFDKNGAVVVGERAVSANLTCEACSGGRITVSARPVDVERAEVDRRSIPFWYPDNPFGPDWEMWRGGHRDLGITTVADFWSPRNLTALAVLWEGIGREPDSRVKAALQFTFTSIANRASRRYQWNAKRPTNVLGGTLYIASLRYEWNVLSLLHRKVRAVEWFYRTTLIPPGSVNVRQSSATDLSWVTSGSVDYCFTDPPFGANIYYADSSLLWESWLATLTDRSQEAVVSRRRDGKGIADYGRLMSASLAEIRRCLKPGGVITMVFQNTDEAVWVALRNAAFDADLEIAGATTLHKAQPSFKGIKASQAGERVAASDVVMTMRRRGRRVTRAVTVRNDPESVVRSALMLELAGPSAGRLRTTAHLYAVAVSALVNAGQSIDGWTFDRVAALRDDVLAAGPAQLELGITSR